MKETGLQERFLNALRKAKQPATFYLTNGFQMKGILSGFDEFTLLVQCGPMQELIFKHAVSTIIPKAPLDLTKTEL